jgi:hypothetical protein
MRLWADFNDIEEGNYVVADLDYAQFFRDEDLHEGAPVNLFDGGGHECQGVIVAVDSGNRLVRVELDWTTWRSPSQLRTVYDFRREGYTAILPTRSFIPNPAA